MTEESNKPDLVRKTQLDGVTATAASRIASYIQDGLRPRRSTPYSRTYKFSQNVPFRTWDELISEEPSDSLLDALIPSFPGSPRLLSWRSLRKASSDASITSITTVRRHRAHSVAIEEETASEITRAVDFLHNDNDLIHACELGDNDRIAELIRKGENVNLRDPIGRTALHFAVHDGNITAITMLLKAGASPNVTDNVGLTPLSICLMRKPSVTVARLLFDFGAVISSVSRDKPLSTGLFLQFTMMCDPTPEETELLALLIEKGAVINDPNVPGGRSALHFAAMSNNCKLIRVLIDLGADVFAINHRGETPFDVAVTFQCKQAIECLRDYMMDYYRNQATQRSL